MKTLSKNRGAAKSTAAVKPVSLKDIAQYLGLSPATISAVINDSPNARSIPQDTKDRVLQAVAKFNYEPNFYARTLRQKRSFTVAVVVPEVSEGYAASVIGGIEERLTKDDYLYLVVSHHGNPGLLEKYPRQLRNRGVEGFILVNTPPTTEIQVPIVAVSNHMHQANVTNVLLDNREAVRLALDHLLTLGHRRIAFFKGHPGSADTEPRWNAILSTSAEMGLTVDPDLTVQLRGRSGTPEPSTPEEGEFYAQKILASGKRFTALFAFNDVSAMGAISAFRDAGLRVPDDVSVIGFDDIRAAAFQNPRLTTVRQPLQRMGELAATTLLERIADPAYRPKDIHVHPELIVRESTCAVVKKRSTAN
jgi:DNA-binding LacI/PurR family transcriptional regulator